MLLSGGSPYLIDSMLLGVGRQEDAPRSTYLPLRLLGLIEDLKQQYPAEQSQKFNDLTQMLRAVCLVRHDAGASPLQSFEVSGPPPSIACTHLSHAPTTTSKPCVSLSLSPSLSSRGRRLT